MDSNKVSFTTTAEDHAAYVCALTKGMQWTCLLLTIVSAVLSVIIISLAQVLLAKFSFYADIHPALGSVLWFLFFFTFYWFIHIFLYRYAAVERVHQDGYFLRPREISIDHNGVREVSKSHESFSRWDGVLGIDENDQLIFIYVDQLAAYVIPKRDFKTPEDAKDFVRRAKSFWNAAMAQPPDMSHTDAKGIVQETAKSPWRIPRVAINSEAESQ